MRFPSAKWHAVRNFTAGGQEQVLGVVVHIMAGTLEGSQAWFDNPKAQASSHFGTGKDGELRQWVDTKDRAWAQGSGNRTYLSVENEGQGGDLLTKAQITANAKVLAWAHKQYGVPLQLAKKVGDRGLAYHALGGAAWGGHTSCPGSRIVAQLGDIVAEAKKIANPISEDSVTPADINKIADAVVDRLLSADKFTAPKDAADYSDDPKNPRHYWTGRSVFADMVTRIRSIDKKLK